MRIMLEWHRSKSRKGLGSTFYRGLRLGLGLFRHRMSKEVQWRHRHHPILQLGLLMQHTSNYRVTKMQVIKAQISLVERIAWGSIGLTLKISQVPHLAPAIPHVAVKITKTRAKPRVNPPKNSMPSSNNNHIIIKHPSPSSPSPKKTTEIQAL